MQGQHRLKLIYFLINYFFKSLGNIKKLVILRISTKKRGAFSPSQQRKKVSIMNGFHWVLDEITVNTEANLEGRRPLTRQEIFILGWLISQTRDRKYSDLMRECKVTPEQCQTALEGLIELDLLRLH